MADKKLSSVSAVSDMNYVYAETSSGETVKISKADLASVVAELIGISKFNTSNYLLYDTRTMIIPRTDRYTVRLHVMATNGNGVYAFDIDGLSGKNPICRLIKYGAAAGNMGTIELTYDDSNIYLNTAWTNNVSYLAYGTEIKITNTKTVGGTAITPF